MHTFEVYGPITFDKYTQPCNQHNSQAIEHLIVALASSSLSSTPIPDLKKLFFFFLPL